MSATDGNVDAKILSAIVSEEEDSDSDRELQIAFEEGLLKIDKLNYVTEKKRPIINKKAELENKVKELTKNLTWIETLDVAVNSDHIGEKVLNDDFEREIIFYKQAEKAVQIAVLRLREMNVRIFRPTDYYAEMVKSDQHMQKIRQRMAEVEESKQKLEAIRRIREEKKFAAKVQKKVMERKQNEKKILAEAVKKHRKGVKSHLDAILNNANTTRDTGVFYPSFQIHFNNACISIKLGCHLDFGLCLAVSSFCFTLLRKRWDFQVEAKRSEKGRMRGKSKKFRRLARDKKFGFGGQKKRSKKNDKNSFEEIATPGSVARKLKGHHFGGNLLKNSAKQRKKR
uniref:rRNA-processing protein EBP2-like protein n=1 Tax=Loa loa TaxID=7209 RepID=A0A1I7VLQ4_LOALO